MPFYIQGEAECLPDKQTNISNQLLFYSDFFFCSFLGSLSLLGLNVETGYGRKPSYVKIYCYSKIFNYPLLKH